MDLVEKLRQRAAVHGAGPDATLHAASAAEIARLLAAGSEAEKILSAWAPRHPELRKARDGLRAALGQ